MEKLNGTDPQIELLLETGGGGAGRHVIDLYKGLTARGWPTRLLVSLKRADTGFQDELQQVDPDAVVKLPMRRSPHLSDIPILKAMHGILSGTSRRHLLHAHSTKAGMLGAVASRWIAAAVFTPHAYRGMDVTLGWADRSTIQIAEKVFSRAYNKIIAVSPDEERYAEGLGIPQDRICYIPNGVDYEKPMFHGQGRRVRDGQYTVGFIGRMVYQKNPLLFLDVLSNLVRRGVPVRGIVVGDGPLRGEMMQAINRLELTQVVTWLEPDAAIEALADIDVVLHTSRYESFPYTLLEAAASLTPIVAVSNSGSEVILGGAHPQAIVAEAGASALADAVTELLCDEASRSAYLASLHQIRERYTIDTMVDRIAKVYEQVLSSE